jgi:hypothetical protein
MKYQAKIVLENKNNSHTLAIDFINQVSEGKLLSVLEVGCSAGYFGEYLKKIGADITINKEELPFYMGSLDKIKEDDTFSFVDLTSFTSGKPLTIEITHKDGSVETILANHTYNDSQIGWFKAGSALNLIAAAGNA